jgi:hypothetical protein
MRSVKAEADTTPNSRIGGRSDSVSARKAAGIDQRREQNGPACHQHRVPAARRSVVPARAPFLEDDRKSAPGRSRSLPSTVEPMRIVAMFNVDARHTHDQEHRTGWQNSEGIIVIKPR